MWLRTGLMLRWLVPTTNILALAMLVLVNLGLRVTLLCPPWVPVISIFVLIRPSGAGATEPGC